MTTSDASLEPFDAAQAAVVEACRPRGTERIALDAAAGRVLAGSIIAADDLVPFPRSAMDGYAVAAHDVQSLPTVLAVAAQAFAGSGEAVLAPGTATAIATGAPLPAGADAVIPIEHVVHKDVTIVVSRPVRRGAAVFPPGDDARRGDLLLGRGTSLDAAAIGLLAAAGCAEIDVFRRPVVAIVCGGDELVPIERTPAYGQVRNSNGVMLAAAVTVAGGIALPPIWLPDTRTAVEAALAGACAAADLVVTTGGASVGARDFVKSVCDDMGVDFLFRLVALRPAKPTAFGRLAGTYVAVLPGNPAAAFAAFAQFVRPAIRALAGHVDVLLPRVSATLAGTIRAKPNRHFAAYATLYAGPDGLVAAPLENQCSSLTRTAVDAAGFIVVPPGRHHYAEGERVDVDVFDWTKLRIGTPLGSRPAYALS